MTKQDLDWNALGAVWRADTLDRDALGRQLGKRLRRQARYRRLEILSEIFITILSVLTAGLLWLNLEGDGRWRQVAMVASVAGLLAGSWGLSLWMRRGTGGEAQSLTAMLDLSIARGESRRRRILAIALGGLLGLFWGLVFWFLLLGTGNKMHPMWGLAFILGWSSVWALGLTGWEYRKWRGERGQLAQLREMRRLLLEDGEA